MTKPCKFCYVTVKTPQLSAIKPGVEAKSVVPVSVIAGIVSGSGVVVTSNVRGLTVIGSMVEL